MRYAAGWFGVSARTYTYTHTRGWRRLVPPFNVYVYGYEQIAVPLDHLRLGVENDWVFDDRWPGANRHL
jgi:hypothetical protein